MPLTSSQPPIHYLITYSSHQIQTTHTKLSLSLSLPADFSRTHTTKATHLQKLEERKISKMATVASAAAAVVISSFTGVKASGATTARAASVSTKVSATLLPKLSVKASLKDVGVAAVIATAASAMLVGNAMAFEILLGGDDGSLAFIPSKVSVPSGEKIIFKNNAGFPHNVVFDEDEIPSGVDAAKISMSEEDLLNSAGETFSVTLTVKGDYSFYCAPHQGAGMVGKITVN